MATIQFVHPRFTWFKRDKCHEFAGATTIPIHVVISQLGMGEEKNWFFGKFNLATGFFLGGRGGARGRVNGQAPHDSYVI